MYSFSSPSSLCRKSRSLYVGPQLSSLQFQFFLLSSIFAKSKGHIPVSFSDLPSSAMSPSRCVFPPLPGQHNFSGFFVLDGHRQHCSFSVLSAHSSSSPSPLKSCCTSASSFPASSLLSPFCSTKPPLQLPLLLTTLEIKSPPTLSAGPRSFLGPTPVNISFAYHRPFQGPVRTHLPLLAFFHSLHVS